MNMRPRDAWIPLALIVALAGLGAGPVLTGYVSHNGTLTVTIGEATVGKIVTVTHQLIVTEYSPLNITAIFENAGSVAFTGKMILTVETTNLTVNQTFTDASLTYQPGEEHVFTAVHYPTLTGFYLVHLNATYADKNVQYYSLFYVEPLYPSSSSTGTDSTGTGGGGSASLPPALAVGTADLHLDYPATISLFQGQSAFVYVEVDNTGQIPLGGLTLLGSSAIPFAVEPQQIQILSPGIDGVFLITLTVPADQEPGLYGLDFTVTSDNTAEDGQIAVTVKEHTLDNLVAETIANYEYVLQRLAGEIAQAAGEGKDVAAVQQSHDQGKALLEEAKSQFAAGAYGPALETLTQVKAKITEVVNGLALLAIPLEPFTLFGAVPIGIAAVVAVMVAAYLLTVLRRARRLRAKDAEQAEE